jgi:hypothetical protein
MDMQGAWRWIKTTVLSMLGGGLVAGISAMSDPNKYRFPQDLGSGKLWRYVFAGWGLTFTALLIKSPLGQKALSNLEAGQKQLKADRKTLKDDQDTLEKDRAELEDKP